MTDKQIRFCHEYCIDWNATRAAIVAGYSQKTAHSIGNENLTKPEIQAYIEQCKKDLERLSGVSALRNINELQKIAYSGLHKMQKNWFTLKEWEEVSDDDKAAISQIKTTTRTTATGDVVEVVEIKLHDKKGAIETLNKMLGYNAPENHNHSVTHEQPLFEVDLK